VVAQALKAAIAGSEPMDVMPNLLFRALEGTHLMRSDISDEIWNAGLKVVLDSVHTHSGAYPGDRDYLVFVSQFIV